MNGPNQAPPSLTLNALHRDLEIEMLVPLWTETSEPKPHEPTPRAVRALVEKLGLNARPPSRVQ